jgi:6,7-dimethyl-8-ribityllumazine synthase
MGDYAPTDVELDASDMALAVVAGRFNSHITMRLVAGASEALQRYGYPGDVPVHWVPGAFEIPLAAKWLAASGAVDAVICIGAVVRGDTPHFEYVSGPCAEGCARVAVETGVPIAFGVLTTNDEQQALERCGGREGNKGAEAAATAVEMVALLRRLAVPTRTDRSESKGRPEC